MKILHISDLHIGEGRNIPDYITRYREVLWQVFDTIKEDITHILISGDIFHRADLRNLEKDLVLEWLSILNSLNLPIYMINGQHDIINPLYTHLTTCHNLIEHNCWTNINLVTTGHKFYEHKDWDLLSIPFDDNLDEDKLRDLIFKYKTKNPLIVMGHLMVKNTKTSTGFSLPGGLTLPDDIEKVYWALGDIHNRQRIGNRAWYAGSIIQHHWGDTAPAYGGMIIESLNPLILTEVDYKYKQLITLEQDDIDLEHIEDAWIKVVKDSDKVLLNHPNIIKFVNNVIEIEELKIEEKIEIITNDFKQDVLINLIQLLPEDKANETMNWLMEKLCVT